MILSNFDLQDHHFEGHEFGQNDKSKSDTVRLY